MNSPHLAKQILAEACDALAAFRASVKSAEFMDLDEAKQAVIAQIDFVTGRLDRLEQELRAAGQVSCRKPDVPS